MGCDVLGNACLRSVGTYFQTVGPQVAWISVTRQPKKDLSNVDSVHNQARTIIESVHQMIVLCLLSKVLSVVSLLINIRLANFEWYAKEKVETCFVTM